MSFMQALHTRWHQADSLVCVGLDPEPAKFPAQFAHDPDAVFNFCRAIVDATADLVGDKSIAEGVGGDGVAIVMAGAAGSDGQSKLTLVFISHTANFFCRHGSITICWAIIRRFGHVDHS